MRESVDTETPRNEWYTVHYEKVMVKTWQMSASSPPPMART